MSVCLILLLIVFFGYVTKLQKVTIRFAMSASMEHGSHWVEFYEI